MKKQIVVLVSLIGAVTLLGAGCSWWGITDDAPGTNTSTNVTPVVSTSTLVTPTTTSATSTPVKKPVTNVKPSTAPLKYTDIMQLYQKSGYRLQFVGCQATPGAITLRSGVKFMLDNRGDKSHKIKIGSKTYTLGAYAYIIATAPTTAGTHNVTCDGGGTARINVEK